MSASGIDPQTGEWVPAFPGQRKPFAKGHSVNLRHGAKDPRVWGPVADRIVAEMLEPGRPPWYAHPALQVTLRAYARHQAQAEILLTYLDEVVGWPFCPCELCRAEDDETRARRARRRNAAFELYEMHTSAAYNLSRDLGPTDPPKRGAIWPQCAAEYGWTRRKPPRDHNGRVIVIPVPPPPGMPVSRDSGNGTPLANARGVSGPDWRSVSQRAF